MRQYNVYLKVIKQSQQCFNGQVCIMPELTTINKHHCTVAMSSHTRNVGFQPVAASNGFGVCDDVGNVGFLLIHPIDD